MYKVIYENGGQVNRSVATENTGVNNVLQVSGLADGDKVELEVSFDGGKTFTKDESLVFESDGTIVLERVNGIIRVAKDSEFNGSNLKIVLGC